MSTLYIAGPMTGLPGYNYDAFNKAAEDLREAGYVVLNPVDIDAEGAEPGAKPWVWYMRRTLKMMLDADHVATLPGWRNSRGATLEVDLANRLGMGEAPVTLWLISNEADQ